MNVLGVHIGHDRIRRADQRRTAHRGCCRKTFFSRKAIQRNPLQEPGMLTQCAPKYLVNYRPEPFVISSFDATSSQKDAIPAVVHQDGTARPQTVTHTSGAESANDLW